MDTESKFWCKRGHFNLDQANYVSELVKKFDPKFALETGFCTGRSTFTVLNSSKNLKKMISIDINFDYIRPEGRQMQSLLTSNFPVLTTIESCSRKIINEDFIKNNFPNGIDWFTIDGDHSYNGCLFDLESIYKYMNKGGIMIIDDYKSGPPNGCDIPQVTKACDDFYKNNPELTKDEWNCKGKGFCIFII